MSNVLSAVLIPSVTAVQRSLIISDAVFFGVDENEVRSQVSVIRHGIRGTQNQNSLKVKEAANLQVMETARTNSSARYLDVVFNLRCLSLENAITSCAGDGAQGFKEAFKDFIGKAESSNGAVEVTCRMARNILNGRWLWRNRQLGVAITVEAISGDSRFEKNALECSLNSFSGYSQEETALAGVLLDQLYGYNSNTIKVTARIDLGAVGSVEVYPSQNYVDGKPDKGLGRLLYKVDAHYETKSRELMEFKDTLNMGLAGIRDQKVWNAIRTIDTWYPEYTDTGVPIPVEPLGANLSANTLYRTKQSKQSLFDYLGRMNNIDPDSDEGMFLFSGLMRGGVFGGENAEKAAKKTEDAAAKDAEKAAKAAAKVKQGSAGGDTVSLFA
jgi:CRISPR-associated protein Csy3